MELRENSGNVADIMNEATNETQATPEEGGIQTQDSKSRKKTRLIQVMLPSDLAAVLRVACARNCMPASRVATLSLRSLLRYLRQKEGKAANSTAEEIDSLSLDEAARDTWPEELEDTPLAAAEPEEEI